METAHTCEKHDADLSIELDPEEEETRRGSVAKCGKSGETGP